MAHKIGSIAWANETGGTLSFSNKLSLIGDIIRAQISLMLNKKSPGKPFDIDSIRIPDSALAKQATELCEDVSSSALYLHCVRTYYWGNILAQQDNIPFDEELFYVIAILHDIALTPTYHLQDDHANCFAVEGAKVAHEFCSSHGWNEQKASQVNEAISLHLNIDVSVGEGSEAHLLRAGSGLDVIGMRRWKIAKQTRNTVLERFPRDGFVEELDKTLTKELRQRPQSRTKFLYQFAQFGKRMKNAGL